MTATATRPQPCRDAQTESYEDVKKWITCIVHKFYRTYGGRRGLDFAELRQEADMAFVETLPNWDPERGGLMTYVSIKVFDRLFYRFVRLPIKNNDCRPMQHGVDLDTVPARTFCSRSFAACLSDDAQELIALTLEGDAKTPDHLWDIVRHEWTSKRFLKAFDEVKENL